jgi:hypothetical protein
VKRILSDQCKECAPIFFAAALASAPTSVLVDESNATSKRATSKAQPPLVGTLTGSSSLQIKKAAALVPKSRVGQFVQFSLNSVKDLVADSQYVETAIEAIATELSVHPLQVCPIDRVWLLLELSAVSHRHDDVRKSIVIGKNTWLRHVSPLPIKSHPSVRFAISSL